jgi:nicotinic acid phosphoribosyltransferase
MNLFLVISFIRPTAAFGIGTYLTNDFSTFSSGGSEKSKALNMVIKLASVGGRQCVKISDDINKVCRGCFECVLHLVDRPLEHW